MQTKQYFPEIEKIKFEGTSSRNPLAYRYYDADRIVCGKPMNECLKFPMAWWHTLCAGGADQFGGDSKKFPWNEGDDLMTIARQRADAGFEIMSKLGIEYFCFHDTDLIGDLEEINTYEARMKGIVE